MFYFILFNVFVTHIIHKFYLSALLHMNFNYAKSRTPMRNLLKMYSVSVKCLIFTLIINFYIFFGQSTGDKELTIAKDNISKAY
jgi:hypothetical protein